MAIKHNHPFASKSSTLLTVPHSGDEFDQSTRKKRCRSNRVEVTTTITASADDREKEIPAFLPYSWSLLQERDISDGSPNHLYHSHALSIECKLYKMMMTTISAREQDHDTTSPKLIDGPPSIMPIRRAKKCMKLSSIRDIPPLPFQ